MLAGLQRAIPSRLDTVIAMRSHPPVLSLLPLLLAAAACGDSSSENGAATYTIAVDTLGDTVVVRTEGDAPASGDLALREVWRVGDPDGDERTSFGVVHSVVVNRRDEVYVFDASAPNLRHYASDGELLRVIGAKGSGPGEYTRSNGLAVFADGRLALWDAGSSRVNVYSDTGAFLTQWMPPIQQFNTSNNSLIAASDGGVYLRAFVRDTTLQREALGRAAWFRFDTAGVLRDTILHPFYGEAPPNLIARVENNTSSRPVPFMPTPQATIHPDGFVVGSPGAPYVVYTRHANRPLRIERRITPVPVPAEELAQTRELVIWGLRLTDPKWTWDGPSMPSEKAPVRGVVTTLDGQTVVSVSTESEPFEPEPAPMREGETPRPLVKYRSATAYELFARDGRLRGRITLPHGARFLAMRGDDAWGTVTDSLDIPYLVRWRIESATRP